MLRTILFGCFCILVAGLGSLAQAADRNVVLAQFPGPPGPPAPWWPGPAPAEIWVAHQGHCETLARHLRASQRRLWRAPPPARPMLEADVAQTEAILRQECWGP